MTEQEHFEAIGRKQMELDRLNIEYSKLLIVLSQVVSGEVTIDRVTVDLPTRSWSVIQAAPIPAGPGPDDSVQ